MNYASFFRVLYRRLIPNSATATGVSFYDSTLNKVTLVATIVMPESATEILPGTCWSAPLTGVLNVVTHVSAM